VQHVFLAKRVFELEKDPFFLLHGYPTPNTEELLIAWDGGSLLSVANQLALSTRTSRKIKLVTVVSLLALLLASSFQMLGAIGLHYELDKPYYHLGDAGKLLLVLNNDEACDCMILRAEMDIAVIGVFKYDMSAFLNGLQWKKGRTVNIEIFFKIPIDAQPREYEYTIIVERRPGPLITQKDKLSVYASGEGPPSQLNPFLLVLIALPPRYLKKSWPRSFPGTSSKRAKIWQEFTSTCTASRTL
jgi:hypothetical protein